MFGENDLVDPSELVGLPGAPFTQTEVDAAVGAVRNAAGWHIAPTRTETAVVITPQTARRLYLPTRKLVSVEEIRDVVLDSTVTDTTYRVLPARNAIMKTSGWWTHGCDRYEVDFTHGYDECPAELLPVIAEAATLIRRDASARTLTAGPFTLQVGENTNLPLSTADTLDRYRLVELGAA